MSADWLTRLYWSGPYGFAVVALGGGCLFGLFLVALSFVAPQHHPIQAFIAALIVWNVMLSFYNVLMIGAKR